jgi:hypothetical protein
MLLQEAKPFPEFRALHCVEILLDELSHRLPTGRRGVEHDVPHLAVTLYEL